MIPSIPQHMLDQYAKGAMEGTISGTDGICNERGFLTWQVKGDVFEMHCVFGDGGYWQKEMERIAVDLGCKRIVCGTWRNPLPMCRKYGYSVLKTGSILEKEL